MGRPTGRPWDAQLAHSLAQRALESRHSQFRSVNRKSAPTGVVGATFRKVTPTMAGVCATTADATPVLGRTARCTPSASRPHRAHSIECRSHHSSPSSDRPFSPRRLIVLDGGTDAATRPAGATTAADASPKASHRVPSRPDRSQPAPTTRSPGDASPGSGRSWRGTCETSFRRPRV